MMDKLIWNISEPSPVGVKWFIQTHDSFIHIFVLVHTVKSQQTLSALFFIPRGHKWLISSEMASISILRSFRRKVIFIRHLNNLHPRLWEADEFQPTSGKRFTSCHDSHGSSDSGDHTLTLLIHIWFVNALPTAFVFKPNIQEINS